MAPSGSAHFPFKEDYENNCLARAHTVEGTVLSAIRVFLLTKKGSRLGNKIGCILPELKFQLIGLKNLGSISNELLKELSDQFPGVSFISVDLTIERNYVIDLVVKITLSIPNSDSLTEMNLKLPTIFSPEQFDMFKITDL